VASEFELLWTLGVPCVPLRSVSARECLCVPEIGANKIAQNLRAWDATAASRSMRPAGPSPTS